MPDSYAANVVNGIDVDALKQALDDIQQNPGHGKVGFNVRTAWTDGARSETAVDSYSLGGETIERHFVMAHDEPTELLGTNTAPNPQEMLMASLNACMTVGYVAGCAMHGIRLESLEIETAGELDLRGFLGIDDAIPAGYETLRYVVRIRGNGTPEQFRDVHETVIRTSPNYFNLSRPVRLDATLHVES